MEKGITLNRTDLRNFGKYSQISVEYNGNGVSYICAPNGGGKTTLTIVQLQACLEGIAENKSGNKLLGSRFTFIGPAGKSADIGNRFHDERTDRYFTITNHLTAQGNEIKIKWEDDKPAEPEWLEKFLSVELMSEKHFCSLTGQEQALALGIDTSSFDKRLKELKEEARDINLDLKKIGEIVPVEKVDPISIDALKEKRKQIAAELNALYLKNRQHNNNLKDEYHAAKQSHLMAVGKIMEENHNKELVIVDCEKALTVLVAHGYSGEEVKLFVENLPQPVPFHDFDKPEPEYIEETPSGKPLEDIDAEIEKAQATNRDVEKYQEYLKKVSEKEAKEKESDANSVKQEAEKIARLAYINEFKFGFAGLTTNENGELELNGRPIRDPYFSTGERIKIVSRLMVSRSPLFKTVFLDSYCELDDKAGPKLIEELLAEGFQPIVSIPNEKPIEGEYCIVLRDCKLVDGKDEGEKLL